MAPLPVVGNSDQEQDQGIRQSDFQLRGAGGILPIQSHGGDEEITPGATPEDGIEVYTVDETTRLLHAASKEVVPFLVLSMFCGIRRATLERLDWKDVRFNERKVVVPRFAGKNQQRYSVTLEDNAMKWLAPYAEREGSFVPSKRKLRRLVVEAARAAGVTLKDNGMRHSFISYHVEHFQSIDKTALEADNSPQIIEEHYLHIVTKEEAVRYWEIRPQ